MAGSKIPYVTLNTGVCMPTLGLGTWKMTDSEAASVIPHAADYGYRLIDTAVSYGNERGVGRGVRDSGLPRDEFFITSKIDPVGYASALRVFEESVARLGLTYLDLCLIHWPMPSRGLYVDTWRALVRLLEEGCVRAIGVSNFMPSHVDRIVQETGVVPAVDQIQLNPRIVQEAWTSYARAQGIVVQSWSPLGRDGSLLQEGLLTAIGARYGKSPAQVIIRWHLDLGFVPIPKSSRRARLAINCDVFDFKLSEREIEEISTLHGSATPVDPEIMERD